MSAFEINLDPGEFSTLSRTSSRARYDEASYELSSSLYSSLFSCRWAAMHFVLRPDMIM